MKPLYLKQEIIDDILKNGWDGFYKYVNNGTIKLPENFTKGWLIQFDKVNNTLVVESINPQNNIIIKSINSQTVIDNLKKIKDYDLDHKGLELLIIEKGKRKDLTFYDLYVRVRDTYIIINSFLHKLGYNINKKGNLVFDIKTNVYESLVLHLNNVTLQIFNKELFNNWFLL